MFNRCSQFLWWVFVTLWFGILVVGLWPFNFYPRNRIHWIRAVNGLHFDANGQAYSPTLWHLNEPSRSGDPSFSIELWLRTRETQHSQVSSMFSIYGLSDSQNLSIAQSGSNLLVRGYFRDLNAAREFRQMWFYDVCRGSQPVFVTIVSSQGGTMLYRDAKPQQQGHYNLFPERYFGRLLLGDAHNGTEPWTGDILGLAVYGRALSAGEVAQHYQYWLQQKPVLLEGATGLFTFDEEDGDIVHNRAGSAPNLIIPARFMPLHLKVLAVPHPFRFHRIDTVVNIFGFIPFGFILCAYLADAKHNAAANAFVSTITLGALISLAIELLQVFLPSRDSSLLDVVNNVVGTCVGAFLQLRVRDYWREAIWWVLPATRISRLKN